MTAALAPPRHAASPARQDQTGGAWRNLWFLSDPPDTTWGEITHLTRADADRAWRAQKANIARQIEDEGDGMCDAPYQWLRQGRIRFAIPLPDQAAP